jgi:hypothetical protein
VKIVKEFSNAHGRFSIFEMNNKFIIKIEKGNYEQTYKLNTLDYLIQSSADIDKIFDDAFMQNIDAVFLKMHKDFHETIERNNLA